MTRLILFLSIKKSIIPYLLLPSDPRNEILKTRIRTSDLEDAGELTIGISDEYGSSAGPKKTSIVLRLFLTRRSDTQRLSVSTTPELILWRETKKVIVVNKGKGQSLRSALLLS